MGLETGRNAVINEKFGYQAYNRMKNHQWDADDPSDPQEGMIWWDPTLGQVKVKKAGGVGVIYPFVLPEGMIVPWVGGYFTDGANGGYTVGIGGTNTAAGPRSVREHSLLEVDDPVRALRGLRIVRHHEDRLAEFVVQPLEQAEDLARRLRRKGFEPKVSHRDIER